MAKQTITPGKAPIVWSTVEEAFTKINANFTELYASIGDAGSIGFDALETDLIPSQNDTYDLGAPLKRWSNLYLNGTILIGGAVITSEGLTVNLPSGTRVGGDLIIDPNKTFFKEFTVNGDTSIVAEDFNDVLDFQENTGIGITTNSAANAIIIENTGVTSLAAGTAIAVSGSTGSVTVSNTGVTAITAGLGMSRSTATGTVTIANTGIVDVDAGNGISVGARDPATGKVIVTNTLPAGNAYRIFATAGEPNLTARSTADTLTFIEGAGINITNTVAAGAFTNRITLENTGVVSLTAGAGIVVSSATGAITVSFNNRTDIIGSVFADDSTMLVDGTSGRIVGNVLTSDVTATTNVITPLVTSTGQLRLVGVNGGLIAVGGNLIAEAGNGTTGGMARLRGGISTNAGVKGGNVEIWGGTGNGGAGGTAYQGDVIIQGYSGNVYIGDESIGAIANTTINGSLNVINGSIDGDIIGSVFADNSTRLIDGTEGKIVGPVDSNTVTASSYIQTAVYVDLTAISAALPTPSKGMIVFDDGTNQFRGYDGSSWVALN